MTKIICRTGYKLSLSNIDRIKIYNKKDIKYVDGLIDYFSDDKKRVLNMVDYFTGKINKHENYNLVLENGRYATEQEIINRKKYIGKKFNKSNIWQVVLSFDKKFIDENISWRDLELKLAKEILPKFFKEMGFEDSKKCCINFHYIQILRILIFIFLLWKSNQIQILKTKVYVIEEKVRFPKVILIG